MSVKERVKKYAKYSKITVKAFEESIDSSNGYVNAISKSIGIDKISLIIEKYSNLNIEWLLTGKGDMLKKEIKSNPDTDYMIELQKHRITSLEKDIENYLKEIEQLKKELSSVGYSRKGDNYI